MNYRQQISFNNQYFSEQAEWLVDTFQNSNVIVFGKKGSGKDVLFATVIHLTPGLHYANMPYNAKTLVLKSLRALGVGGNTYKDIVNGTITKYPDPFIPGLPIFISDGAVYFGSQNNSEIDSMFPELAIYEALSRQLGQHQIHVNTQALGRLYIKMREQADVFIKCLETYDCGRFLIVDAISYDKYASADAGLSPYEGDKNSKEARDFEARFGEVEYRSFYVKKSWLKYDTYYFSRLFLDGNKIVGAKNG